MSSTYQTTPSSPCGMSHCSLIHRRTPSIEKHIYVDPVTVVTRYYLHLLYPQHISIHSDLHLLSLIILPTRLHQVPPYHLPPLSSYIQNWLPTIKLLQPWNYNALIDMGMKGRGRGGGDMTSPLDGVANDIVKIIVRQWSDAFPIYLHDHITIFTKYIYTAIFYMSRETTAHTIDRYHLYYTSLNHTNVVPPYLSLQRLLHQDWSLTMYVPVYVDINNPPTWQM